MSENAELQTPPTTTYDFDRLYQLADEADKLLSCFYYRYMTGQLKREQIQASKAKLIELRELVRMGRRDDTTEANDLA